MHSVKLLYVIDSLAPGGAETSLAVMTPGLLAHGIELHVLPLHGPFDLAETISTAGATIHGPAQSLGRLGYLKRVVDLARSVKPDLVHTSVFEADIAGRAAGRLLRIPYSTSLVNEYYGESHSSEVLRWKLAGAQFADRLTSRGASRFHAVSQAVKDSAAPALALDRDRIEVIPRGRDPRHLPFRPSGVSEQTRSGLGLAADTPVILGVGRLEPQKGFRHLLESLALVAAELPAAVLLIAGRDGRASANLRALATQAPLEVRFLGHRTDMPQLLAMADVLAFPSEREGSPGTLIEAMAAGTPIVSSDIAPCLEVLGGRETDMARVTPLGDIAALAAALVDTITNKKMAQERADLARARFEATFTIDSVAKQMAGFFDRAKEGPRI
ncbi:glycosyltransferase family 4 protein [Ammonicoccus fulvus]|uniref:Glycosyltransferase family 4 protein n=1 Tax=Ammonicoccus fulvus TaxID=3138240 RepID=A0ABZ3FMU0_9ACTN